MAKKVEKKTTTKKEEEKKPEKKKFDRVAMMQKAREARGKKKIVKDKKQAKLAQKKTDVKLKDLFEDLQTIYESALEDSIKQEEKGQKSAGTRLRKWCQQMKKKAQEIKILSLDLSKQAKM